MAFHEGYWVATATASPVIGLAHVVNIGAYFRALLSVIRSHGASVDRLVPVAAAARERQAAADEAEEDERLRSALTAIGNHRINERTHHALDLTELVERVSTGGMIICLPPLLLSLIGLGAASDLTGPWLRVLSAALLSLAFLALIVAPFAMRRVRAAEAAIIERDIAILEVRALL